MPSPVNQSVTLPPHSQGMRGHEEKSGQSEGAIDKGARTGDDSARISETAKTLNQAADVTRSNLNGEQAQQLASDIRNMFQASPQQAMAAQGNHVDNQLHNLLQQSA